MIYLWLSLIFMAAVLVTVVIVLLRESARRELVRRWWGPMAVGIIVLFLLTAVFDNLMIHADLITYNHSKISGVRIGQIPIEDFFYPLAGVVLLPTLWFVTRPREKKSGTGLFRQLVIASRPLSWINTAFPFAAAYVMTLRHVDATAIVGTLFFLIPYNLAMYGINDVFDYESDLRNPRKGGAEGALLDRSMHRRTLISAAVLPVPFLIYLVSVGSVLSWVVLAVSLFFVVAYSMVGLRFKEVPFLDSVTSSIHFVSPAVYGLVLAGAHPTYSVWFIVVAFFLWGVGSHAFGAVQDVVPDREGHISSIATVLGASRTVRLAVTAWALAGLVMLLTAWPGPLAALLALPYILAVWQFRSVSDEESGTAHRGWQRFLWINYACGFIVTMLLIWSAFMTSS